MNFTPSSIAALIVAVSFAAGLNVYATVATLGILARFDWVTLPPGLTPLPATWIIIVAMRALRRSKSSPTRSPPSTSSGTPPTPSSASPSPRSSPTRPPPQLSPEMKLLATIAGAAIAAIAHTSKTAARALVTPSPEPLSNIALSASEDVAAISLTWLATHHPYAAGAIATVAIVFLILSIRWIATPPQTPLPPRSLQQPRLNVTSSAVDACP